MNKEHLEEFRVQLEEKKKQVIAQLDEIGHRSEVGKNNFDADFPNYGESLEDSAVEVADFCGKEIEAERLKIRPESSACVECKNKMKGR